MAIRTHIEQWKEKGLLSEEEYFILLFYLIESISFFSNTSGIYSALQKNGIREQ